MLEELDEPVRGLVVASPANPTGTMLAPDELAALARWCEQHGVQLVSDEIYHGITYGSEETATAAHYLDSGAVVVNSFSKYWAMTGWRLGWLVLPDDLLSVVDALAGNVALCPPALAQHAGVAAFSPDGYAAARQNVERYFGGPHPAWQLTVGDLQDNLSDTEVDRVILDMLAPWECLEAVSKALVPGGIVCCYVATTTQLARTVESIREIGCFNEPTAWETMIRNWHIEGLAVRPDHRMIGHTGFLLTARRLADGVEPPMRRRRPAKGAYGEDYEGPNADGGTGR